MSTFFTRCMDKLIRSKMNKQTIVLQRRMYTRVCILCAERKRSRWKEEIYCSTWKNALIRGAEPLFSSSSSRLRMFSSCLRVVRGSLWEGASVGSNFLGWGGKRQEGSESKQKSRTLPRFIFLCFPFPRIHLILFLLRFKPFICEVHLDSLPSSDLLLNQHIPTLPSHHRLPHFLPQHLYRWVAVERGGREGRVHFSEEEGAGLGDYCV